ncbi:MAP3K12-binding inhibitory protein 1-like [Adelges cooleyi]|uniref:MAP3K12-binding inhibitory protein 1-like n=1 Tax=Adelges cooleyi TaxID=133065 RepID=UPI00217FFC1C|nr:MAP3K12-binding inhibitory protein 1-like [Adelges cooleyi]
MDSSEVQISKPTSEVTKRISFFMKRKREDNDDRNPRLYCNSTVDSSSARTCSTVAAKRQKGSECYVKLTKVHNDSGPQCNGGFDPASKTSYEISKQFNMGLKSDIRERISNLESCMKIKPVEMDIYKKLKILEDRVLELESMLSKGKDLSSIMPIDTKTKEEVMTTNDCSISQISEKTTINSDNLQLITSSKKPNKLLRENKPKYSASEIQQLIEEIKKKGGK